MHVFRALFHLAPSFALNRPAAGHGGPNFPKALSSGLASGSASGSARVGIRALGATLLGSTALALAGAPPVIKPLPGAEGTVAPLLAAHLVSDGDTRLAVELSGGDAVGGAPSPVEVLVVVLEGDALDATKGPAFTLSSLRGSRVVQRWTSVAGATLELRLPDAVFGSTANLGILARRGSGSGFFREGQSAFVAIALPPRNPASPLPSPPAPGAVLVTEFMKDPAAVSDVRGEWLELQNRTDHPIDLEGWTLRDDGSNRTVITAATSGAGVVISAGGFLVMGRNADTALNGGVALDAVYSGFTLGNGADQIILEAPGAAEIDRVEYEDGTADWPDLPGASIGLSPRFAGTPVAADGAAWCSGVDPLPAGDLGSPGELNPECGG